MVAPVYLLQVLQMLLNHIDINGHSYDRVPVSTTITSLQEKQGIRKEVIQAILLTWFGKVKEIDEDSSQAVELKVDAIIRFMGLQVLETRAKGKLNRLEEFVSEWEKAVGPNLSDGINVQMLKVSLT